MFALDMLRNLKNNTRGIFNQVNPLDGGKTFADAWRTPKAPLEPLDKNADPIYKFRQPMSTISFQPSFAKPATMEGVPELPSVPNVAFGNYDEVTWTPRYVVPPNITQSIGRRNTLQVSNQYGPQPSRMYTEDEITPSSFLQPVNQNNNQVTLNSMFLKDRRYL